MKRHHDEDESSDSESDSPKIMRTQETAILQDLQKGLTQTDNDSINNQLLNTQKQYFTMYMEKLMNQLPMGKDIIATIHKNGQADDFMYVYTASKTIIQSIMTVKQHKAMKSIVDMVAGIVCRYMHDRVISPMLQPVIQDEHLKRAFHAYQSSIQQEENDNELEMRCLLHCIHQTLKKDQYSVELVNPLYAQMTQQMKAVSDYVVTLLISVSKPVEYNEMTSLNEIPVS